MALLWFGLLFPERSRIDVRWPWLKWLALAVLSCNVVVALVIDYGTWYNLSLVSNVNAWNKIENINDHITNWTAVFCITLYWVAIFANLRARPPPMRGAACVCFAWLR